MMMRFTEIHKFKYEVLDQEGRRSEQGIHVRHLELIEDKEDLPQPGELCFDGVSLEVYNDVYFKHLPLRYQDDVTIDIVVRRMPYEEIAKFLEEKVGKHFQEAANTTIINAFVAKWKGPPQTRYYNDFSVDEVVN
nr:hypothetical protein [Tanacetum cinerariifolium]